MRKLIPTVLAVMALCTCASIIAQDAPAKTPTRLEVLQARRAQLGADLLDAITSHDAAKQDFAEQLLDDCDIEIALLGGPVSERVPLISEPKTPSHLEFRAVAYQDEPRHLVVRVPSAVIQRAKDEAQLANMLNSDVEDSQ